MRNALIAMWFGIAACGLATPALPHQSGGGASDSAGVELAVASAAELDPALTEVARAFEQKTGTHVRVEFADSADFYLKIRNGAAFDAFFSADMDHPQRLAASGTAVRASLTEYAHDGLVLCLSPMMRVPIPPGNPLLVLRDKTIQHVAISDPKNTAAGKLAIAGLQASRLNDISVRRKFLIGEDIAQTVQLAERGSADVTLLPMSATHANKVWGTRVIALPPNFDRPMRMGAVVITRSKQHRAALEFIKFAASTEGQAIFERYGFYAPRRVARRKRSASSSP